MPGRHLEVRHSPISAYSDLRHADYPRPCKRRKILATLEEYSSRLASRDAVVSAAGTLHAALGSVCPEAEQMLGKSAREPQTRRGRIATGQLAQAFMLRRVARRAYNGEKFRAAVNRLKYSEARYRTLVEQIPAITFMASLRGRSRRKRDLRQSSHRDDARVHSGGMAGRSVPLASAIAS